MTLVAENLQLKTENQELRNQVIYLTQELNQLKRMVFGQSSERSKTLYYDNGQMKLFEDEHVVEKVEVKKLKVKAHDKVKARKKPKRNILPANLPRESQTINPEGIDPNQCIQIGEDISETLAYKPGEIYVKRIIRPRLISQGKEDTLETAKAVMQAPIRPRLIPRGIVDESLIAHKYLEWLIRKTVTEKITDQALSWLPHKLSPKNREKFIIKQNGV